MFNQVDDFVTGWGALFGSGGALIGAFSTGFGGLLRWFR